MSRAERRALVERENPTLPVLQQCWLLAVPRSTVYRRPAALSEGDCAIMALIDRQYLARPYYGSRRMAAWLATQGHIVNRKRAQRLMRLLGLTAIYQRPQHEQTRHGAQDLSLPPWRAGDRPGEPSLVFRRYLYPDGQGLPLPGRDHGLGEPRRADMAVVEHARRRFLCRSAQGSAFLLRSARDLQYRPRQPIHQRRLTAS
jgi:putative transposase